jgi:hypothetical protein
MPLLNLSQHQLLFLIQLIKQNQDLIIGDEELQALPQVLGKSSAISSEELEEPATILDHHPTRTLDTGVDQELNDSDLLGFPPLSWASQDRPICHNSLSLDESTFIPTGSQSPSPALLENSQGLSHLVKCTYCYLLTHAEHSLEFHHSKSESAECTIHI